MSQEIRNKIYAVAGAVGLIAVTLGFVTPEESETGLGLIDQVLTVAGSVITLGTTVLAFVKSLTSRVTTVEVPKKEAVAVQTTSGIVPVK